MTRKYKVIKELRAKGWPTADKDYKKAHEKANKDEKKKFGKKAFDYMEKVDAKLKRGELAGKNTKTGKIEVSSKVPKRYRAEVAEHERAEYAQLEKDRRKKRKK